MRVLHQTLCGIPLMYFFSSVFVRRVRRCWSRNPQPSDILYIVQRGLAQLNSVRSRGKARRSRTLPAYAWLSDDVGGLQLVKGLPLRFCYLFNLRTVCSVNTRQPLRWRQRRHETVLCAWFISKVIASMWHCYMYRKLRLCCFRCCGQCLGRLKMNSDIA